MTEKPDDPSPAREAPEAEPGEGAPKARTPRETAERRAPRPDRLEGEEWTQPRRLALIVAFAVSLALYLGTGAGLLRVPGTLPVAGGLTLASGFLEVPTLLLYVAGLERRATRVAPMLLLAGAGGLTAYFVGGAIGITSPTVLGAAVLALVLFLFVGHRAVESRKRRIRRVRRWSRNGVVLGIVLLIVALALYTSYSDDPTVTPIAHVQLTQATSLSPGESYNFTVSGATGDQLYLLLGCSNPASNVQGRFQTLDGTHATANITAGTSQNPGFLPLSLQQGGGSFRVVIQYPSSSSAPGPVTVNWTEGDIPAGIVAMGAAAVPAGWAGFILIIVAATLWVVSRPPDDTPSTSPPSAPDAPGSSEGSEAPSAAPAEANPPASSGTYGSTPGTTSPGTAPLLGWLDEPPSTDSPAGPPGTKVSDEGTTSGSDVVEPHSSGTSK